MKKLRIPFDFSDVVAVAGMGAVFYGLYLVAPAAAYVAIGGLLILVAPRLSRK